MSSIYSYTEHLCRVEDIGEQYPTEGAPWKACYGIVLGNLLCCIITLETYGPSNAVSTT